MRKFGNSFTKVDRNYTTMVTKLAAEMENKLFVSQPDLAKVVLDIENGKDTFLRLGAERGIYLFQNQNDRNELEK
jgi:hypothetical protein